MKNTNSNYEIGRLIVRISTYVLFAAIMVASIGYLDGLNLGRTVFLVAATTIVLTIAFLTLKPVVREKYGESATVVLLVIEAAVAAFAIFLIVRGV